MNPHSYLPGAWRCRHSSGAIRFPGPPAFSRGKPFAGECVFRYDNERGKGDHRHFGARDVDYAFSNPDQLMLDFNADIARWNDENGHS